MKEFTWVNMVSTKVIKCDPKVSGSVFPKLRPKQKKTNCTP